MVIVFNKTIFLILIMVAMMVIIPAYAQTNTISLSTSKSTYNEGDTIVVSGKVSTIIISTPVTLQIFYQGNLVEIAQLDVAKDGTFSHTIIAKGPLWKNSGDYVVRALYGQGNISETTFSFFNKGSAPETPENFEVDAGKSGTFDVKYTIRGGTVKNMIVDPDIFALVVIINSTSDGAITLELPRNFIDAKKTNGSDDTYIILIDGIEVPYQETDTNSQSRTIKIEFVQGDSDIEIIGTFVVPEFGIIVGMILAVSLTIVIISNKRIVLTRFQN